MTDEQCAKVLEDYSVHIIGGRGCGKTATYFAYEVALQRAIKKLRGDRNDS